jgi:hypothetical protein
VPTVIDSATRHPESQSLSLCPQNPTNYFEGENVADVRVQVFTFEVSEAVDV